MHGCMHAGMQCKNATSRVQTVVCCQHIKGSKCTFKAVCIYAAQLTGRAKPVCHKNLARSSCTAGAQAQHCRWHVQILHELSKNICSSLQVQGTSSSFVHVIHIVCRLIPPQLEAQPLLLHRGIDLHTSQKLYSIHTDATRGLFMQRRVRP